MITDVKIQHRSATPAQWAYSNPVLLLAELGFEVGTGKFKIGDGVTPWNGLPYFAGGGGGSDASAAALAYVALQTAWSGTSGVDQVYPLAETGTYLGELALTWIGTLISGNVDEYARSLGYTALQTAWSGTSGANSALFIATQGTSGVNEFYPVAVAGTNLAYAALQTAWAGTAGVNEVFPIAVAGTNLAYTALQTAWAGTSGANSALFIATQGTSGVNEFYPVAVAGTNLAYTALQTAWSGTSGANSALSVATAGTSGVNQLYSIANSGTSGANSALFIATQGTSGVNEVLPIATYGTNLAYTALQTAWSGTSGANSALTLAASGTTAAAAAVQIASSGTYYIATNGTDTLSGTSVNTPWATWTHAASVLSQQMIPSSATVTVLFAAGTYSQNLTGLNFSGGGSIVVTGQGTNQDAVVFNPPSGYPLYVANQYSNITFTNLKLEGGGGVILAALSGGGVTLGNLSFGSVSGGYQVWAGGPTNITWNSSTIHVFGGAASFIYLNNETYLSFQTNSIKFMNACAYSAYVVSVQYNASMYTPTLTFVQGGTCTGPRYIVDYNSVITGTGGLATYFPGTTAGTTGAHSGWYG